MNPARITVAELLGIYSAPYKCSVIVVYPSNSQFAISDDAAPDTGRQAVRVAQRLVRLPAGVNGTGIWWFCLADAIGCLNLHWRARLASDALLAQGVEALRMVERLVDEQTGVTETVILGTMPESMHLFVGGSAHQACGVQGGRR